MLPKKQFTESMVRRVLLAHQEVEPETIQPDRGTGCLCGWEGQSFVDHVIDRLHVLWHDIRARPREYHNDIHDQRLVGVG